MPAEVEVRRGGRLDLLTTRSEDLRPLLARVALITQQDASTAFREQGKPRGSWDERGVPNVAGIVSDLNRGVAPPERRWQDRPALIDTGRLRSSIVARVVGSRSVEVGTTVPYAAIHEYGGTSSVELGDVGRRTLARLLREARGRARGGRRPRGTDRLTELGWLFARPRFDVEVPPRPFLSPGPEAIKLIGAQVRAYLGGNR